MNVLRRSPRALTACYRRYTTRKSMRSSVVAMSGQVRHHPVSDQEDAAPAEKRPRVDVSETSLTPTSTALATSPTGQRQRKQHAGKEKKRRKHALPEPCSAEDVLWRDIISLLGSEIIGQRTAQGMEWESPFGFREELEVVVSALSSNGDALAIGPDPRGSWVIVAPFALPGERIRVRVYRSSRLHSFADLLEVVSPNLELRDDSRIGCKYFGKCSGCQYQMLSYKSQLDIKRNVVIKAYQNFSGLPESLIPNVLPTIGSPLQYNYRTKITPHFEAPPRRALQTDSIDSSISKPDWLKIGFNEIGKRTVMDIEDCPIATPVLNEAFGGMRKDIANNIWSYKKGASLLLRDSIEVNSADKQSISDDPGSSSQERERHICITDPKATVRERVGDKYFEFPGHSFFQNNNSILVPLTDYVRDAIFPKILEHFTDQCLTHLVDAYCGSGLFSIMLCSHFQTVAGIELSSDSIKFATHNAHLNDIPEGRCTFRAGDAANIFSVVSEFPREKTALIIDPPRKGCDENFIDQLVAFRCKTVVYISCNVHTQARDVGMILDKMERHGDEKGRYVLESLRGFDLFPQTAHVESVAVLRLI